MSVHILVRKFYLWYVFTNVLLVKSRKVTICKGFHEVQANNKLLLTKKSPLNNLNLECDLLNILP